MILRVTTSAAGLWTVSENDFVLSQRSSRDEAVAVAELVAAAIGAAGGDVRSSDGSRRLRGGSAGLTLR